MNFHSKTMIILIIVLEIEVIALLFILIANNGENLCLKQFVE